MKKPWQAEWTPYALFSQLFRWVELYLDSGRIAFEPALFFENDAINRKLMYLLNINKIVQHLWDFIECATTTNILPVFNAGGKTRSTADMPTWWTVKNRAPFKKTHISHVVFDSGMESTEAYKLDHNPHVTAFAKNDHLNFSVLYTFNGVPHYYYPDFLVKLDNGKTLILETKGKDSPEVQAKRKALAEWVDSVNSLKEFGVWCSDISFDVADVDLIIGKYL